MDRDDKPAKLILNLQKGEVTTIISKEDEDNKTSSILSLFKGRIVVQASGRKNIDLPSNCGRVLKALDMQQSFNKLLLKKWKTKLLG